MKFDLESISAWFTANKRIVLYLVVGLVFLLTLLFAIDQFTEWREKKGNEKIKDQIANNITDIKKIDSEISVLEGQKIEKAKQIESDTKELVNTMAVREDLKAETNQALANFNKALNSNSNVNVTAEDLEKKLRELEQR